MFTQELMRAWGFAPLHEAYYLSARDENPHLVPAKVVMSSHGQFRVLPLGAARDQFAKPRGQLRDTTHILVGDWVLIGVDGQDHEFVPIEMTLPRLSVFGRASGRGHEELLANVSKVALVTSFNEDLNVRRLERGLVMARAAQAEAAILLNKSDLVSQVEAAQTVKEIQSALDCIVLPLSAEKSEGIESVSDWMNAGETLLLLGMSGVGKSTLTNALLGGQLQETSSIREDDGRGRHTTSHRELFLTADGFWIADIPGLREFSPWGEEGDLKGSFTQIGELIQSCRFTDCRHVSEPGCGIRKALENGSLEEEKWQAFLKLEREMLHQQMKGNKAFQSQRKKIFAKRNIEQRKKLKL